MEVVSSGITGHRPFGMGPCTMVTEGPHLSCSLTTAPSYALAHQNTEMQKASAFCYFCLGFFVVVVLFCFFLLVLVFALPLVPGKGLLLQLGPDQAAPAWLCLAGLASTHGGVPSSGRGTSPPQPSVYPAPVGWLQKIGGKN